MRLGSFQRLVAGRALFLATALALVAPLSPFWSAAVLAVYNGTCDGVSRDVTDLTSQDVTSQTYWVSEVISISTAIRQYPCVATGGGSGQSDVPFILGANLQYVDVPTPDIVQLGFARCETVCPSGWTTGQETLVYTPVDNDNGVVHPAIAFNEGNGPGILSQGIQYETAILAYGSNWEFGVRNMTSGVWTYWFAPNHWPVKTGGNWAWWGTELWNWQSVMGHRASDPAFNMQSIAWKESDTGVFHPANYPSCTNNGPSYFQCWLYNGGWLDSWTNNH
jgi:hypothetical protein